jgi:competence protein ComEA
MRLVSLGVGVLVLSVAAAAAAAPLVQQNARPDTKATVTAPIDLNSATAAQLETLPGIGPKTAERIIQYREKNGGFKKIEELMNVRGVGEKSFLKLKALIVVHPLRTKTNAPAGGRLR